MAVTKRDQRRKGDRRQSDRKEGNIEKITIQGKRNNEREVVIRHETVPPKKASSVWSWHEEFVAEWSESFIPKKGKKIQKDEKETREK